MIKLTMILITTFVLSMPVLASDVAASWDPNTESDLAGYKIYYGTKTGAYDVTLDAGNVQSVTVQNLQTNTTYFFAVTAYDTSGNESGFSNEISLFIAPPADTNAPQAPQNVKVVITISSNKSQ